MTFDPGLQPERTDLAWTRTGLGYLVNAALVLRLTRHDGLTIPALSVGGALALTAAVALTRARALYPGTSAGLVTQIAATRSRAITTVWITTTLAALASTALVVELLL